MSWRRTGLATFAGSLPAAAHFAVADTTARSLENSLLVFGLVMVITGLFWLDGRRLKVPIPSPIDDPHESA